MFHSSLPPCSTGHLFVTVPIEAHWGCPLWWSRDRQSYSLGGQEQKSPAMVLEGCFPFKAWSRSYEHTHVASHTWSLRNITMLKVLHSTPTMSAKNHRQTKKRSHLAFGLGSPFKKSFVEDETMATRWKTESQRFTKFFVGAEVNSAGVSGWREISPVSIDQCACSVSSLVQDWTDCLHPVIELNDAKFWNMQKQSYWFCIFWDVTHIDSTHLTRFSTLSLLTSLAMIIDAISVVWSPFAMAILSVAGNVEGNASKCKKVGSGTWQTPRFLSDLKKWLAFWDNFLWDDDDKPKGSPNRDKETNTFRLCALREDTETENFLVLQLHCSC